MNTFVNNEYFYYLTIAGGFASISIPKVAFLHQKNYQITIGHL